MDEEIKDTNCIVKAFENHPVSILQEELNNKKMYWFRASDIGKVLGLSNINVSIQNYDDHERGLRKAYTPEGGTQHALFLTSQGVYRLLYNSKKDIAKKFRKWVGNILDDIIFNNSIELKKQLENHQLQLQEKEQLLIEQNKQLKNKDLEKKRQVEMTLKNSFDKLGVFCPLCRNDMGNYLDFRDRYKYSQNGLDILDDFEKNIDIKLPQICYNYDEGFFNKHFFSRFERVNTPILCSKLFVWRCSCGFVANHHQIQ
jgi:prophage antirepressor-like protein